MTASTGSAYPLSVDELVPRVRERMAELGRMPSRNQIMSEFKVGAPKARAVLDALTEPDQDLADDHPVRALRSVPVGEPATEPDPETEPGAPSHAPATLTDGDIQVMPAVDPVPSTMVTTADAGEAQPTAPSEPVMPADSDADPADLVTAPEPVRQIRRWPIVLLALPAFVAIWGGWVGLGRMTGFGPIVLLPGIWDELVINSAITLPIGVEAYAAFAMSVWLSGRTHSARTRRFAMWSALGSLALGMAGQVAYHLMSAAGITTAPWLITTFVACLPVVVLGCGAALMHLMHEEHNR